MFQAKQELPVAAVRQQPGCLEQGCACVLGAAGLRLENELVAREFAPEGFTDQAEGYPSA